MKHGGSRLLLCLWSGMLLALTACGGGGGGDSNSAPTANAGADQTVSAGAVVTLSGSGADSNGSIASYAWTQTGGPAVTLLLPGTATPTFTAPSGISASTLTFSLTVTDNQGLPSAADTVTINVQAGVSVSISGKVTFARVPLSTIGQGLDYASTRQDPARAITVEAIVPATLAVLATTVTDASGNYSLTVLGNTSVVIRAKAEMVKTASASAPGWSFQVRNVSANATSPYTFSSIAFNPGTAPAVQNLDIPSGWNTVTRTPSGERSSAPFAILDTVYKAFNLVLTVAPNTNFPVLTLDWSDTNPGGQTFYDSMLGTDDRKIVLSGEDDIDTDEFDEHVIAHEFGHYLEDRFSRSDSLGGAHGPGDRLDHRVAFGEGFGYAFAAMVLNDPQTHDTFGNAQLQDSSFSVENDSSLNEGWYSEASVQEILWDVFDDNADSGDTVALGFAPIWQVLIGDEKNTNAVTGIFPFVNALKTQNPSIAAAIDARVSTEVIQAIIDDYGTGQTNNAGNANVLPLFTPITIGGGPVTVRSLSAFGTENKLGNHRLLKLDVGATSNVRITVTAPTGRDADLYVLRQGGTVIAGELQGDEDFTVTLQAGTYVLDTYECDNAGCGPDSPTPQETPITVTVAPN